MKQAQKQVGRILVELLWNLVTMVLTVAICYLLYMRGSFDRFLKKAGAPPNAALTATPIPAPVSAANSEKQPLVSASAQLAFAQPTPMEAPTPASTPEPTPTPAPSNAEPTPEPPLDLGTVDRRSLPLQVKLRQPVEFPIIANGQQVGTTSSPMGMTVRLIGVQGNQLEVQCGGVTKMIPAEATDVVSRVRNLQQYTGGAPATAAAASTPVPTPWVPMLKGVH